ncbi:DUF6668 family protein [Streptomyces sp. NPDC047061]|uniref:DUF6668 family protein n=1 Tax=Streptomyces sp. NPDC047061 TaxID=3154605 RepID=UPI0033E50320
MSVPPVMTTGSQLWVRGPTGQQSSPTPGTAAGLVVPASSVTPPSSPHPGHRVAWVNAHGGAGASTLARILGGADVGRRWPDPADSEPGPVLLVARTHAAGITAASQAMDTLRRGTQPAGVELVALVLVADAPGRLPRELGRRVRVLRSAARVHRVPWVPAWRIGEEADALPREVRALSALVSAPTGRGGRTR